MPAALIPYTHQHQRTNSIRVLNCVKHQQTSRIEPRQSTRCVRLPAVAGFRQGAHYNRRIAHPSSFASPASHGGADISILGVAGYGVLRGVCSVARTSNVQSVLVDSRASLQFGCDRKRSLGLQRELARELQARRRLKLAVPANPDQAGRFETLN